MEPMISRQHSTSDVFSRQTSITHVISIRGLQAQALVPQVVAGRRPAGIARLQAGRRRRDTLSSSTFVEDVQVRVGHSTCHATDRSYVATYASRRHCQ